MKRTVIVSALALVALLLIVPATVFGQEQNPIFATQEFVESAIQEFNQNVVDPLAAAVAALQGEVDELEQRVETLEADQGGGAGTGTVRGRTVDRLGTVICLELTPASGRLVSIQGTDLTAVSGADGTFVIEGVPVGRYFEVNASGEAPHYGNGGFLGGRLGGTVNNVFVPTEGANVNLGGISADLGCGKDTDDDAVPDEIESIVGSDPNDPNSTPEDAFLDAELGRNTCSDGIDNDLDGLTDGADPGW